VRAYAHGAAIHATVDVATRDSGRRSARAREARGIIGRMRRIVVLLLVVVFLPAPAGAWGLEAHKFIMDRAIALLPAGLRPLFERRRAEVVERSVDPDLWIIAGWDEERPRHFLDMDTDGAGPYPFAGLPHDYTAAVAKFGAARMRAIGTLPWRTEDIYGSLVRAFRQYPRSAFAEDDIIHFSSWLAHYTSDGHVPLHAVTNYNGQLTGQTGLHSRWEATLFERYRNRLAIAPAAIAPIRNPREYIFGQLLQDTTLVPALLAADRNATGDRDVYDDGYYQALFAAQKGTLEQRLNDSIAAVAAMITGAWETAGKPPIQPRRHATPERRRR
jgi:hypothetical protein